MYTAYQLLALAKTIRHRVVNNLTREVIGDPFWSSIPDRIQPIGRKEHDVNTSQLLLPLDI